MRQEIDKIKIKEPPIEELSKKRSCIKTTCGMGCGCFTVIFIISLFLLKFSFGPQTKELRDLPTSFTDEIELYDTDDIERIVHTSGKEKNKRIEMAAYIPKLILAPIVIYIDENNKYIKRSAEELRNMSNFEKFKAFMSQPIADEMDIFQIEWQNLNASQKFLLEFYEKELDKKDFIITERSETATVKQFTFSQSEKHITGVVYTMDDPETTATDFMSLTVNVPSDSQ